MLLLDYMIQKNNKLIKINKAYESSIITFDDLKEIALIEKKLLILAMMLVIK